MGTHRASIRYAKSLMELSREQKSVDEVKEDMQLFTQVVSDNYELDVILKNPIIPLGKKTAILNALFGKQMQPLTLKAFELIVSKGRDSILDEIAIEFVNEYNTIMGIAEASVATSYQLDDTQRKEVTRLVAELTGKKVDLKEEVDPSIIGGFLLKIGDRQIDESVKNKLTKIKRALVA